ncbi:MAG: hypothetical protein ACE5I1_32250, partial [bacterium]
IDAFFCGWHIDLDNNHFSLKKLFDSSLALPKQRQGDEYRSKTQDNGLQQTQPAAGAKIL